MRLSPQKLVLLTLYTMAALALISAALVFAHFKDELRPTPQASVTSTFIDESPDFEAFEAPDAPVQELAEDVPTEDWDILDPIDPTLVEPTSPDTTLAVGQSRRARQATATLFVITNFEKAKVTVNGVDYPAYGDSGDNDGIVVPAGGPHHVLVNYAGNEKLYEVFLGPNERRYLMVELTGFRGSATPYQSKIQRPPVVQRSEQEKAGDEDGQGRITVYSRPRGQIFIGGSDKGQATPGTIEVESGRHDVQVRYEDGEMSEKKVVRVRQGSRIKLFFRQ